jgi:hypothetical protein
MQDLFEALAANGFAKDSVTLGYVIANTWQDAQYSPGASANAQILSKYLEYKDVKIGDLKRRFESPGLLRS